MKKKSITIILAVVMTLSLCACDMEIEMPEPTCKYEDCEETDLYDEGYCKYHFYLSVGDNLLKDLIN